MAHQLHHTVSQIDDIFLHTADANPGIVIYNNVRDEIKKVNPTKYTFTVSVSPIETAQP